MSTRTKWIWTIVVLLIVVVLGVAAFAAGSWFGFGGRGEFGMMERGYNHMQPYDRHAFGFRSPLGWLGMGLGMLLMWALPLGFLALAVVGAVSLIRGAGARKPAPPTAVEPVVAAPTPAATTVLRECESCHKPAQADWKMCPYCGTPLGD
jgi:hypothetical protein